MNVTPDQILKIVKSLIANGQHWAMNNHENYKGNRRTNHPLYQYYVDLDDRIENALDHLVSITSIAELNDEEMGILKDLINDPNGYLKFLDDHLLDIGEVWSPDEEEPMATTLTSDEIKKDLMPYISKVKEVDKYTDTGEQRSIENI